MTHHIARPMLKCTACAFKTEKPGRKCVYGSKCTRKNCPFAHARYQYSHARLPMPGTNIHTSISCCNYLPYIIMSMALISSMPVQPVWCSTLGWRRAYILPRRHSMHHAHLPIRAPMQGLAVHSASQGPSYRALMLLSLNDPHGEQLRGFSPTLWAPLQISWANTYIHMYKLYMYIYVYIYSHIYIYMYRCM